jgi:hypothetical protein
VKDRSGKGILRCAIYTRVSTAIQPPIELIETAAAMMQGKGAGSGWDMRAEISVAALTA